MNSNGLHDAHCLNKRKSLCRLSPTEASGLITGSYPHIGVPVARARAYDHVMRNVGLSGAEVKHSRFVLNNTNTSG